MNFVQRLFGKSDNTSEILCPHCEKAMEPGHKCAAMSRRFFFGLGIGAAAAIALPAPVVEPVVPYVASIVSMLVDQRDYVYDTYTFSHSWSITSVSEIPHGVWTRKTAVR